MPVINPSTFEAAQGTTVLSNMGATPAPLVGVLAGTVAWFDAAGRVLVYQNSAASPSVLRFIDLDTNVISAASASGANALGAGNSVWAAELNTTGVRTNVGGLGPFTGAALGDVSETGQTAIIIRKDTAAGISVYDATGALEYTDDVVLTSRFVRMRQGMLAYQDQLGWHLIDVSAGAELPGWLPRADIGLLIPFLVDTTIWVLEYEIQTGLYTVRPFNTLTGWTISPGTVYAVDIVGSSTTTARMAWSTSSSQARIELVLLDIDLVAGTTSLGTVSGTSMAFATGPVLTSTAFPSSTSSGGMLPVQSAKFLNEQGQVTKPWRDALQNLSSGLGTVTTRVSNLPVSSAAPSFGTIGTVVAGSPGDTLALTSSDSTVTITPNQATKTIDFVSPSTGITQLTGDVTAGPGSGSQVATIANDAVTFAKMQNVGANSFIARAAGSTGDLSAVALSASQLAGRGASGDIAAIVLGSNLSMSGTTINAAAGGGGLTSVTRVLTDAEIKSLNTVPLTLVTGSSNQAVIPWFAYTYVDSQAGAYSASPTLFLQMTAGGSAFMALPSFLGFADRYFTRVQNFTTQTFDNASFATTLIFQSSADVTGGNAANTMTLVVYYSIETATP